MIRRDYSEDFNLERNLIIFMSRDLTVHLLRQFSLFLGLFRATEILSTCPIDIGDEVSYGTIVAPGVLAPYHQHIFSLRIDPAIKGTENSLQVEESHPMPVGNPEVHNPFGAGYTTSSKIVTEEGGLDLDFATYRTFTFKIINEKKSNPIRGTPVGFKISPGYSQMLLADAESFHAKRSEYASHAIWVTRYVDDELYPAGRYTMQSLGGEGIRSVIEHRKHNSTSERSVRNKDIVIWHAFGSAHNPRIEDWPVMPSEKMVVGLKLINFFTRNPSLDVAVSTQARNQCFG